MKRILLVIACCLCWAAPVSAKDGSVDRIAKTSETVASLYFELGFHVGVNCGMQLTLKMKERAESGKAMTHEEAEAELVKCSLVAMKKYNVK